MSSRNIIPRPVAEYDLRLLRIFKAVVENGGFSAAETDLGITRSTISVHMANLETRMQLKLCIRGRQGFALTEDGRSVYHAATSLFESMDNFSVLVTSLGKQFSGELVILCSDQINQEYQKQFARIVQLIYQESASLHLVFDGDSIANIEKLILSDKAHAGILPNFRRIDGLQYATIIEEPIYLCCSNHHAIFNLPDSDITLAQLSQLPAIHPGIDIDVNGREQLKKLNLVARAYQFDTRKSMILSGKYIGYLPQSYIQQELQNKTIRLIKPEKMSYLFNLSLVTKIVPREIKKRDLIQHIFSKVFAASD
jgi:LysR family transcriptional regulator, transcriptional activator for bauABCD operon